MFTSSSRSVNSSFPTPLRPSDSQQAPSVISSRMTDVASQDEEIYPEGGFTALPAVTGQSFRRPLYELNRTPSAVSSRTRPSTRSPPSRRGPFGGPGGSMWNTSRPMSATSRSSKTHVPALASQAFFRPMSSQHLQARRARPTETGQFETFLDGHGEAGSNAVGYSLASKSNARKGPIIHQDTGIPPGAVGSKFFDADDGSRMNASRKGTTNMRSNVGSEGPTLDQTLNSKHSDLGRNHRQGAVGPLPMQKTSMLFQARIVTPTQPRVSVPDDLLGHERHSSPKTHPDPAQSKIPQRVPPQSGFNYEYFPGNTVFCCGGRLQNAQDVPINVATGIIAVIPSVLFLYYSAPWLWHNVSPAIPIFFAYISFICISSFIHASVTDPGILPRNVQPRPQSANSDDPLALGPPTSGWIQVAGVVGPMDVPVKYCKTCNIWRPPRCHHCRVCDNCIEAQDHHCVWLNNCVGRRNYRYFFTFVATGTLLGLFLTFASLGHCLRYKSIHRISFAQSINQWRVPFAMVIYGILATPYPASLFVYHLFLRGRGQTTREFLNSRMLLKKDRFLAFNEGSLLKNWLTTFLRPRPPTYLQFKRKYEDGDQRFGPRRSESPLATEQLIELRDTGNGNQAPQSSGGS